MCLQETQALVLFTVMEKKQWGRTEKRTFLRVSATLEGDIMEFAGNGEVLVGDSPALEGNSAVLS